MFSLGSASSARTGRAGCSVYAQWGPWVGGVFELVWGKFPFFHCLMPKIELPRAGDTNYVADSADEPAVPRGSGSDCCRKMEPGKWKDKSSKGRRWSLQFSAEKLPFSSRNSMSWENAGRMQAQEIHWGVSVHHGKAWNAGQRYWKGQIGANTTPAAPGLQPVLAATLLVYSGHSKI